MKKYNIITLCGSTKYKEEFLKLQKELTLKGNIVLGPVIFSQSDNIKLSEEETKMLSNMHRQKIDICDEIYVINVNGYIGKNTKNEIEYAKFKNKKINYLQ